MVLRFFFISILFSYSAYAAEKGVYIIDRDKAIRHVLGYEEYETIESVENEKLNRRLKRETQILSESMEKFKFESPHLSPTARKAREKELISYGKALQELEKKLIAKKDKALEQHYTKVKKQWRRQSRSFFRKKKSKIVFLKSDGKMIYRGKGVTPLRIKVFKAQKKKEDITEEFITHANKLAGRKVESEDEIKTSPQKN